MHAAGSRNTLPQVHSSFEGLTDSMQFRRRAWLRPALALLLIASGSCSVSRSGTRPSSAEAAVASESETGPVECLKKKRPEIALVIDASTSFEKFTVKARQFLPIVFKRLFLANSETKISISQFSDVQIGGSYRKDQCFRGITPLTNNQAQLNREAGTLMADLWGGQDLPEDSLDALAFVSKRYANFTANKEEENEKVVRIIFILVDSPPHNGTATRDYDQAEPVCNRASRYANGYGYDYPDIRHVGNIMRTAGIFPMVLVDSSTYKYKVDIGEGHLHDDPLQYWKDRMPDLLGYTEPNKMKVASFSLSDSEEDIAEHLMLSFNEFACDVEKEKVPSPDPPIPVPQHKKRGVAQLFIGDEGGKIEL